jgi:hypothetical protein
MFALENAYPCNVRGPTSVKQPMNRYPPSKELLCTGMRTSVLLYKLTREAPPHVWLASPAQGMLQPAVVEEALGESADADADVDRELAQ